MFYEARVNMSLARLGIDPRVITTEYRQGAQAVGTMSDSSPQETALFIASQLPVAYQLDLDAVPVKAWIRQRKLNPKDPEMREALLRLGWHALIDFS